LQLAEQQLHAVLLQHLSPLQEAALQIQDFYQQSRGSSGSSDSAGCFRYLGLDTSLAPGLDTPPLTDSYQSLLQHMLPARAAADAGAGDTAVAGASVTAAAAAAAFGGPGSLTVSSLITSVLKRLPLRLTGYCGLMLAVCEDQVRWQQQQQQQLAGGHLTWSKLFCRCIEQVLSYGWGCTTYFTQRPQLSNKFDWGVALSMSSCCSHPAKQGA
jgi:hypothetical protein